MNTKKQGPSWWLLYLLLPIMIGLFLIEIRLSLSDTAHKLAELLIFLVFLGSISLWLKANAGALVHEDLERWQPDIRTDLSPISPQPVRIVQKNKRSKHTWRIQEAIHRRLTG
jgi:hypothetical protein